MTLLLKLHQVIETDINTAFELWTNPNHLKKWWGPPDVKCVHAEVDLHVGGSYRLDNQLPDNTIVTISGQYLSIEPPRLLRFSWRVNDSLTRETVTVQFLEKEQHTEVIVVHDKIPDATTRDSHERGWKGCFEKLQQLLAIN